MRPGALLGSTAMEPTRPRQLWSWASTPPSGRRSLSESRPWGLIVVASTAEPPPRETEARLGDFTELVAIAIANADAQAELTASRARIVAAGDQARRRFERDLHDGTQQRLVSLALELRTAQAAVPPELIELSAQLDRAVTSATDLLDELREIARGIHPAILTQGGLAAALRALARRCLIPVHLDMRVPAPLPQHLEASAYYVVAEALTNVAKHSRASTVDVAVVTDTSSGVLRVTVSDNGVGGAHFDDGTGLVGLKDRAEAVGGRIVLDSPPQAGTSLRVELPLSPDHCGARHPNRSSRFPLACIAVLPLPSGGDWRQP